MHGCVCQPEAKEELQQALVTLPAHFSEFDEITAELAIATQKVWEMIPCILNQSFLTFCE